MSTDVAGADLYAAVIGQERALSTLRATARTPVHAYLFVGPSGTGVLEAAQAFAADVLCPDGGCGTCASCRNALARHHPDLAVIELDPLAASVDALRRMPVDATLLGGRFTHGVR